MRPVMWLALRKECPYSKLFWPVFSRIQTEYGEILRISPYSVRMRKNVDQSNSEYRHFSRSVIIHSNDFKFSLKIVNKLFSETILFFKNVEVILLFVVAQYKLNQGQ